MTRQWVDKEKPGPPTDEAEHQRRVIVRGKSRIPQDSMLFERVIPAILAGLGILTLVLILFAAGVLLGIVPFR